MSETKKTAARLMAMSSVSSAIGLALAVPSRLINAYVLGATGLGVLSIAALVKQYATPATLGITTALSRQMPLALGQGDAAEANAIRDIAYSVSTITFLFALVAIWALFFLGLDFNGVLDVTLMTLVSLWYLGDRVVAYQHAYAKGVGRFDVLGRMSVFTVIITPGLVLPMTILGHVRGALIGYVAATMAIAIFYQRQLGPMPVQFRLPIQKTVAVVRIGFLLYINKFADSLFWTVDTFVIAWFLLPADVGQYAFAMGMLNFAVSVAGSINVVAYRRLLIGGGEDHDKTKDLKKLLDAPYVSYLMITSILLGFSYFGFAAVVRLFLPDFLPSLPVGVVLILGQMFFACTYFPSLYFNVTNQLAGRALITAGCLALNFAIAVGIVVSGYGLYGVAWGSTVSYLVFGGILLFSSMRQLYGNLRRALGFSLRALAVFVALFLAVSILHDLHVVDYADQAKPWIRIGLAITDASVKIGAYGILCISLFSVAFWRERPWMTIREGIHHLIHR